VDRWNQRKSGDKRLDNLELPKTPFSNFAKASILMLPSTTEFESDLLSY